MLGQWLALSMKKAPPITVRHPHQCLLGPMKRMCCQVGHTGSLGNDRYLGVI